MKNPLSFLQKSSLFLLGSIYGIFGSSSPDQLSWVECSVFIILMISVGVQGIITPFRNVQTIPRPLFWLFLLFIWGTAMGVGMALIHGQNLNWIVRDYASFLMLCLPLFFFYHFSKKDFLKNFQYLIFGIGTLFSLRVIKNLHEKNGQSDTGEIGALYLSISPEILFTACALSMMFLYFIFLSGNTKIIQKVSFVCCTLLLTFFSTYVLYRSSMRAGIGAVFFSLSAMSLWAIIYRPKKSVMLAMIGIVSLVVFQDLLLDKLTPLFEKQREVGLNQRFEEIFVVSQELGSSPITHMIGLGWGAGIESPSSAGLYVNFTHNLFSSLWLKTGLVGVILMMAFCVSTLRSLSQRVSLKNHHSFILLTALILCLSVNMLLYGGYKSLGFGLCLTLLLSLCFSEEKSIAEPS